MLDLGGDDVLALGLIEVRDALECEVVGLGGTAGPDDFARIGVDQFGNLATTVLDRFLGFPAKDVGARSRVTEVPVDQQAVGHLLGHAWVDRGGRGVIEVDRQLHLSLLSGGGVARRPGGINRRRTSQSCPAGRFGLRHDAGPGAGRLPAPRGA
ncbi:hypothetical protein D3C73_1338250 [compost metagenome]